jgi:hypothetical protein
MRQLRKGVLALAAVLGMAASLLFAASPTSAAVPTAIAFQTTGPVQVDFGGDWVIVMTVDAQYDDQVDRLGDSDGTVDVYLSGIGGAYASALPIQADGTVYFSQSLSQPLLAAGEYQVTAIYVPPPGGYFATSQTAAPITLTVTALGLTPKVEVSTDPGVSEFPVITASLSGAYVDAAGGAPAGTWQFVVNDASGESVYTVDVPTVQGSTDPTRTEVVAKLEKGAQYSVVSTFTPVEALAGGLTVEPIDNSSFTTASGSFGEALGGSIPLPLWLAISLGVLLLALAAASIVLGLRLKGRLPAFVAASGPADPQRLPGDPMNVEIVGLEDMGLPDAATIPELLPEGQETKKLPTSTTWLLSDVEPATSLPDASEAPTERIDAIASAELATELIDTGSTDASTEKLTTGESDLKKDS